MFDLLSEYSFSPRFRIRKRYEFLRVRNNGRKINTAHFIVLLLANENSPSRLGITVSRKVGGAVKRNRVKRLVREFFRLHYPQIPQGVDISIIAKVSAASLSFELVCLELKKFLDNY